MVKNGRRVEIEGIGGVGIEEVMGEVEEGEKEIIEIEMLDEKMEIEEKIGEKKKLNVKYEGVVEEVKEYKKGGVDEDFEYEG